MHMHAIQLLAVLKLPVPHALGHCLQPAWKHMLLSF